MGGRGGEGEPGELGGLIPPIEFDDACESSALEQACVAARGNAEGRVQACELAQRRQVAVIVMIVAEEDCGDGRESEEGHARRVGTAGAEEAANRADALAEHRVGEEVANGRAQEERGVIDPC